MRTHKIVVVSTFLITACAPSISQTGQAPTVVFVCEHGSAKSVIAAAHFNRLAISQGLPYRAISRGVHADSEIPINIKAGLLADGIDVSEWKPKTIGNDDIQRAESVVALACILPRSKSLDASKQIDWNNIPSVSDGYIEARTVIVQKVKELLKTLSETKRQPE